MFFENTWWCRGRKSPQIKLFPLESDSLSVRHSPDGQPLSLPHPFVFPNMQAPWEFALFTSKASSVTHPVIHTWVTCCRNNPTSQSAPGFALLANLLYLIAPQKSLSSMWYKCRCWLRTETSDATTYSTYWYSVLVCRGWAAEAQMQTHGQPGKTSIWPLNSVWNSH